MSSPAKIAIVAALEREITFLINNWQISQREYNGRTFRFFEKDNAVVVCGGIGAATARRSSEASIVLYTPEIIYSAGFAGAASPGLKIGDVVIPRRIVDANDGSTVDTGLGEGVLVSFSSVSSVEQKEKFRKSFQADIVDMEAAAVAKAAQVHGVRFGAVKAISDEYDFELPDFDNFVSADGRLNTAKLAVYTMLRPRTWRSMIQLKRNSNVAAQTLCQQLHQICSEFALTRGLNHEGARHSK